jgi:HD-GYP domain-containing protein (c-di-GMP phosphodiesterase class II)
MNIGKILVPKIILTKNSPLNDDEKNTIRDSMETASELLQNIPFDGAVVDTIRQWQEKWDGSGKLGLKAEEILVSARIIAVANAFIGMVSPRSWRDAMPINAANKFLLEQAGSYFDRGAVIALVNYVENQSGRAWLEEILSNRQVEKKIAS